MYNLSCKDMSVDCSFVGKGTTPDEAVNKVAKHAQKTHAEIVAKMSREMSPDQMTDLMKSKVKED